MLPFSGMPVIESVYLTKTVSREVRLLWRQRLWSWPWRPWRRTRMEQFQEPGDILQVGNVFYVHPATAATLRALTREKGGA
jgi:hypothetical protein